MDSKFSACPGRKIVDRRGVIVGAIALLAGATPKFSSAETLRPLRIGYVVSGPERSVFEEQFERGLRDNGYVVGRNAAIDYRFQARPDVDVGPIMAQFVAGRVDAIVVSNRNVALAARAATTTIPIIFGATRDAIQDGLVSSLSRPEANVTGQSFHSGELSAKRVQLMREAFPDAKRFGVVYNVHYPSELQLAEAARARDSLGIDLVARGLSIPDEVDDAFASMRRDGVAAVFIVSDLTTITNRFALNDAAVRRKMPLMLSNKRYLTGGGLMSYGPDISEGFRRAARQLVRAANGTPIGELPVEQPTRFEFFIDLRAARALGVEIAAPVLARADEVIE